MDLDLSPVYEDNQYVGGRRCVRAGFPGRIKPLTFRFDRPRFGGKGFMLTIQFGPGGGYRYIDLPGYNTNVKISQNQRFPWSLAGRTFRFVSHAVSYDLGGTGRRPYLLFGRRGNTNRYRFGVTKGFVRNGNINVYPDWSY